MSTHGQLYTRFSRLAINAKKAAQFFILFTIVIGSNLSIVQNSYAGVEDLSGYNPEFTDELYTLDYTSSRGSFFDGYNSSAIAATPTSDGGYAVLISSDGSCPENTSHGIADTSTSSSVQTSSKPYTSNKVGFYQQYISGCSIIVKYSTDGSENWRTSPLWFAFETHEGEDQYEDLLNGTVKAFRQINDGIVLLVEGSPSVYILVDNSGNVKYAKSLCYSLSEIDYDADGAEELEEQISRFCSELFYYTAYGASAIVENDGSITYFMANSEYIDHTWHDYNYLINAKPDGSIIKKVDLSLLVKEQISGRYWLDIEGGIYRTVDGYLMNNEGELLHVSEDFRTVKVFLRSDTCNYYYLLAVDNEGNVLVSDCYTGNDGHFVTSEGWEVTPHYHTVFDKNGKKLFDIPSQMERSKDNHDYEYLYIWGDESIFIALGQNRWLIYGEYEKYTEENGSSSEERYEGFVNIDAETFRFDFIPTSKRKSDETSSEEYSWDIRDIAILNDGSIVAVGGGYDVADDEELDKHYNIICKNEQSDCSNAVTKRYYVNGNKIEILESAGGSISTNLEANSNVNQDTQVKIIIAPNPGYKLKKLTVKAADGSEITVNSDYSFSMPGMDVTVSAEYELNIVNPNTIDSIAMFGTVCGSSLFAIILYLSHHRKIRRY